MSKSGVHFPHLNLMSLMALICSWRLLNLNRNQCISLSSIDTGWTPGDLLGVEDLSEDENQHDVLVVFPQTVQLRLAQLEELRHRLSKIFWCSVLAAKIFQISVVHSHWSRNVEA